MSDILERLRGGCLMDYELCVEVADEIEQLRVENERLRAALEWIEEESYEATTVRRAGEGLRGKE